MHWFGRKHPKYTVLGGGKRRDIPDGMWSKCPQCGEMIFNKELEKNLKVCSHCNYHFILGAKQRIASLIDDNSFEEMEAQLSPTDPLTFYGYEEKLKKGEKNSEVNEAMIIGKALIDGNPVGLGVVEYSFMGGSMGSVMGEKITRLLELCLKEKIPAILVSAGGGARMQEGMLSLMQMAKTSAAVAYLRQQGIPYLSILTHPTTGGIAASYAALGDVILAEPKALIGFAGPRVIEQTIGQKLPEGFQTSEFLLEHGMIDAIYNRYDLREKVSLLLKHLYYKNHSLKKANNE